jgi:hypothetical protein
VPFFVKHTLFYKMQIMLHILSTVLQSTTTDNARSDNKCEMNVNNGMHGWMEGGNWWVRLMTWRKCRWGHQMTWTLEARGLVAGLILCVEGMKMKMGSGGGAVMLKQHQIELVRGYLTPCPW